MNGKLVSLGKEDVRVDGASLRTPPSIGRDSYPDPVATILCPLSQEMPPSVLYEYSISSPLVNPVPATLSILTIISLCISPCANEYKFVDDCSTSIPPI